MKQSEPNALAFASEGVEGFVPYCGALKDQLTAFTNGIRSGMSYSGARTLDELHGMAKFMMISATS